MSTVDVGVCVMYGKILHIFHSNFHLALDGFDDFKYWMQKHIYTQAETNINTNTHTQTKKTNRTITRFTISFWNQWLKNVDAVNIFFSFLEKSTLITLDCEEFIFTNRLDTQKIEIEIEKKNSFQNLMIGKAKTNKRKRERLANNY